MTYKMLVVDIDDTLVNSHNQITPETIAGIQALQAAGHAFVLASGRPTASVLSIAKSLGMDQYPEYIISFNGAVLMNALTQETLFAKHIETQDLEEIIQTLQANDLAILTYDDTHIVLDRENAFSHIEEELTGIPTRYDATFFEGIAQDVPKFIGVGDPDIVSHLETTMAGRLGQATRMVSSKPFYLEIMHESVSKGDAIKALCQHLHIDLSEVIAMGDGNNDLQMLEVAGKGIAVANASPAMLDMADEIAPSNDDNGVLHIIQKYFLA